MIGPRQSLAALLALSLWASPSWADTAVPVAPRPWPNDFVARLEASLLLQTLNADLLSHDSATLTLERWCADHQLAAVPRIVAERILGADKLPTEEQRREQKQLEHQDEDPDAPGLHQSHRDVADESTR